MRLLINGIAYEVPKEEELLLLRQFRDIGLEEYKKVPQHFRVLGKPVAREILKHWELEAARKFGKDASLVFRPEKKADPIEHLANIFTGMLQEFLKDVTFGVSTTEHFATHFSLSIKSESEGGGPVVAHGDQRIREDGSPEIS